MNKLHIILIAALLLTLGCHTKRHIPFITNSCEGFVVSVTTSGMKYKVKGCVYYDAYLHAFKFVDELTGDSILVSAEDVVVSQPIYTKRL